MTLQGKQQTKLIKQFVRQTPARWLEKRFMKSNLSNSVAVQPIPQTEFRCQQTSIDSRSHLGGIVFNAHYKVTAGVHEYVRRISEI